MIAAHPDALVIESEAPEAGDEDLEPQLVEVDLERQRKKRKPSTTPTQRCMAEIKRRGWTGAIAEKWVRFPRPGHHVDLFGVIDIVAIAPPRFDAVLIHGQTPRVIDPGAIVGIQASPGTRHAAHRDKILAEPRARLWVEAGGRPELWSWSKRGDRGKRKLWTLRVEAFTVESWASPIGGGQ